MYICGVCVMSTIKIKRGARKVGKNSAPWGKWIVARWSKARPRWPTVVSPPRPWYSWKPRITSIILIIKSRPPIPTKSGTNWRAGWVSATRKIVGCPRSRTRRFVRKSTYIRSPPTSPKNGRKNRRNGYRITTSWRFSNSTNRLIPISMLSVRPPSTSTAALPTRTVAVSGRNYAIFI